MARHLAAILERGRNEPIPPAERERALRYVEAIKEWLGRG
jgi:hypothetical protein